MKKLPLIILFLVFRYLVCDGQTTFEPQMLILSPGNFTFDPSLQKEVDAKNQELKKMSEQTRQAISGEKEGTNLAVNLREIQKNDLAFLQEIDFPKQLSLIAQQYLIYRFYEKFPNCLILLKDEKSNGSLDNLQKIASDQHMPYVLNFSKVSLYKQNSKTYCKLQMQLYEQGSNKLLIDKEYTGDWNNPGFEFTCEQGSIGCTISNALSFALPDVIFRVASNNPTIKKEKELAIKRSAFINSTIYPQSFDDALVRKVIPSTNSDIELNDLYHCFYNSDNTKFVAFFIKTIAAKDAKSLLTQKKDGNVNIITTKDIHDPGYLDESPRTYAYIVRGIQYQSKWYFDKSEVTYFDAANLTEGKIEYLNNLQKWNFFADDSAEPANDFWEGKLFEKIKDRKKDPNWEKYKKMWATEEREDRDYIGMCELVADVQKKEKELADEIFRKQLIINLLKPFYEAQIKLKLSRIVKADTPAEYNLIYPKDKHVILNPIKITDEHGIVSIRYFVFLPQTNEVFEWNLATPHILHKDEYTDEPITKTINALTTWDYSYKTLDDDAFWNEKVLAKDGANYKYLNKLQ
ncbi:MAG TPA: hypothetical protein VGI43_15840 [Mucilaginibacter sp.]|jgi:hypothetical protein